jgi:AraC-like DNA-binding protein
MTPGSLLLGNSETCFSCGHEHGEGDRCLSFYFATDVFERIAADAGVRHATFSQNRVAACRNTALAIVRALQLLDGEADAAEIAYSLASLALRVNHTARTIKVSARDERRVIDIVRWIERSVSEPHTLEALAKRASLSPYHFLRVFKAVAGISPHQFILRARMRAAARRLSLSDESVTTVALACGFSDLANFTRGFRAEFGRPPGAFRR